MNITVEAIKAVVSRLCKEKGISINRLSELAGMRQSTLSSIMNGRSQNPTFKTLEKIAKGFDVDFDFFIACLISAQDELERLPYHSEHIKTEAEFEVAKKVRSLRQARGISLLEVCEATGLHMEFEREAGDSNIVLAKLCSYFNVTADYFLGLTDEPLPISSGASRKRKVS